MPLRRLTASTQAAQNGLVETFGCVLWVFAYALDALAKASRYTPNLRKSPKFCPQICGDRLQVAAAWSAHVEVEACKALRI